MTDTDRLDLLCINTIRTLSMDAVEKAKSGHPGAPMGMAPGVYLLFDRFLRHDPADPSWPNRDRFVLSMGHASMLLYSILHLTGYDVTLDDIKQFRQLHSKCPGHPEHGLTPGVETTTGPLGQGAGNSVGMAIAGQWLAQHFNRPGYPLFDYRVFALCSDGDMMEGVASEAASLAGHLGLDNLVWIYDSNRISIDGPTSLAFSEDVGPRFTAYGWHVQHVTDANNLPALERAIQAASEVPDRPALIVVDSHIAYGSPNKQDSADAHGAPLGADEVKATKKAYGWDPEQQFHVPPEVTQHLRDRAMERGRQLTTAWNQRFESYRQEHSKQAEQWRLMQSRGLPENWSADLPQFNPDAKGLATRAASGKVLSVLAERIPWLFGGSADLAGSNQTLVGEGSAFSRHDRAGRNLFFGVREHAMGAICNGLALCGLRPYAATFLVFSDYMRPSIRLAALMRQPVIYVFTHDSLGVGEDGPTHQPIEHLAALRAIPRLDVVRPADAVETAAAWRHALQTTDRPVALILTRQNVPTLKRLAAAGPGRHAPDLNAGRSRWEHEPGKDGASDGLARGGYVLRDDVLFAKPVAEWLAKPHAILIGTGSEVQLCVQAAEALSTEGVAVRVVSIPCRELFDRQPESYRHHVLPPAVRARVAVEAGVAQGWHRYVGPHGVVVACEDFGTSAPGPQAMMEYGFTAGGVVKAAQQVLSRTSG